VCSDVTLGEHSRQTLRNETVANVEGGLELGRVRVDVRGERDRACRARRHCEAALGHACGELHESSQVLWGCDL
jgi:hypothetical protein